MHINAIGNRADTRWHGDWIRLMPVHSVSRVMHHFMHFYATLRMIAIYDCLLSTYIVMGGCTYKGLLSIKMIRRCEIKIQSYARLRMTAIYSPKTQGINFLSNLTRLISFQQEYVRCNIESYARGIIREESARSRVCCWSSQLKARSRRKPPSRRSFQFQNCSPRNQSRVRMPRHTRNMLPLPLYCCYITLTPILQIRRGSPAPPTYKITSNLGLFSLKIPVPFLGDKFLEQFMLRGLVSSHANG